MEATVDEMKLKMKFETTTTNDGGEEHNNQPEVGRDDGGAADIGQTHTHTTTRQSNGRGVTM